MLILDTNCINNLFFIYYNLMNYYKVLGLSKNIVDQDKDIVKKSYKKLAMKWHPDKWIGKSEQEKIIAENKFKEITKAYEILTDQTKKKYMIIMGKMD